MVDAQVQEEGGLYLDDLQLGQTFLSETKIVEKERMLAFAAEFDPQPFHLTDQSPILGGLAASGWLTAALTHRLLLSGGFPIAGGMIGVSVDVSWPAPTRAGDTLRVATEVIDIKPSRSKPDVGIVSIRSQTFNQMDVAVQIQLAKVVVRRRPIAAD